MYLHLLGVNHKTAPLTLREKLVFAPEKTTEVLVALRCDTPFEEIALLSTCNRIELYGYHAEKITNADQILIDWLSQYHQIDLSDVKTNFYYYQDDAVVKHMIRVASGLDSMVLGEPQILGQIKSAYTVGQTAGTIGSELNRLFQHIFTLAKKIRTDTAIGENPISFAFIAMKLAQHIFSDINQTKALLIGAGEIIHLIAKYLQQYGVKQITIANRTLKHADSFAQEFNANAILLADIPTQLKNADIVISSTASQHPLLGKSTVESALKQRKHRPIFMVDLAVPRDIEPEVNELADVYLYNIDDLKTIIDENRQSRENAITEAERLIEIGTQQFLQKSSSSDMVKLVKHYRAQAEIIRDDTLNKARHQLAQGESTDSVLQYMANTLTNKLIHGPSIEIKKAGKNNDHEKLSLLKELLNIPKNIDTNDDNNK